MDPLEDRHWSKLAVPLAWVRDLDEHPAPNALADALGDRYLCRYNPIFARVRDAALGFGYRFSSENTLLWRDYQALSLTTLHRILKDRVIPYFDTTATVKRLLAENPRAAMAPGYLLSNLKRNYAFHESAHGVAHAVLERFGPDLRVLAPDDKARFVLEAVFAEAFANTVERLGSSFEQMPISDTLFYALNSYLMPRDKRTEALKAGGRTMGAARRFVVLFLAAFEANLTLGSPSDAVHERVAEAAGCPAGERENAKPVIEVGFELSGGFRDNTTPMYFGLLGYQKEYEALVSEAWLARPESARIASDIGRVLFDVAGA